MREQRECRGSAERKIAQSRKLLALGVGEFNCFGAHGVYLISDFPSDISAAWQLAQAAEV